MIGLPESHELNAIHFALIEARTDQICAWALDQGRQEDIRSWDLSHPPGAIWRFWNVTIEVQPSSTLHCFVQDGILHFGIDGKIVLNLTPPNDAAAVAKFDTPKT